MIERLAIDWFYAEQAVERAEMEKRCPRELLSELPQWFALPERKKDEIRARVVAVLEGEVRRSEMGPGDLRVSRGRIRTLHDMEPPARFLEYVRSYDESRDFTSLIKQGNWWSAKLLSNAKKDGWGALSFFDNQYVGQYDMTNLQIGGMLASDQAVYLASWYLSIPMPDQERARRLEHCLSQCVFTLCVGDMPQVAMRGDELWREPRPVNVIVPVRQNFGVRMDAFGLPKMRPSLPDRWVWVHLEGWRGWSVC